MKKRELFLLSITIFFTIIAWMLLDIYKVKNVENIENIEINLSTTTQLNFKIDPEVLKALEKKIL